LITDLLTLARIESDTQSCRDETVQVPELLEAIIEEARILATAGGHLLIPDICPDYGLRGNPDELRTAFTNLIANAIQHTPNRSEIRIVWGVDQEGARLCISDTGEGIANRHLPRLGERFYRIDNSRSRDTGGTGLGLAIVRQVLESHEATLEISSKMGHGSMFCCHFPARRMVDLRARTQ
jgi:two-component system phosphate regulon sensor histidine kinase PhoR